MDNNPFFLTSCSFLIQKQQLETRRIANLNVPNINNTKYCPLYLKAEKPFTSEVLFLIKIN